MYYLCLLSMYLQVHCVYVCVGFCVFLLYVVVFSERVFSACLFSVNVLFFGRLFVFLVFCILFVFVFLVCFIFNECLCILSVL